MSALVHLKPFEYSAQLVSKSSPEIIRCHGTVYAADEEQALEEVERQYRSAQVGVLQQITVEPRWPDQGGHSATRHVVRTTPEEPEQERKPQEPEWELWHVEGLDFWMGSEPVAKPFTVGEQK